MERFNNRNITDRTMAEEFSRIDRNVGRLESSVGMIEWFAGPEKNVPDTHFVCDGKAVGRQANPRLFSLIGTVHGVGDGETSFNLPNLLDKIPAGIQQAEPTGETEALDLQTGASYDVSLFRLIPVVRKG